MKSGDICEVALAYGSVDKPVLKTLTISLIEGGETLLFEAPTPVFKIPVDTMEEICRCLKRSDA